MSCNTDQENRPKQSRLTAFFSSPGTQKRNAKSLSADIFDIPKADIKRKCFSLTPRDLNQLVLDAGQKEIGKVYCNVCDMVYSIDCAEDTKAHNEYHNRHSKVDAFLVPARTVQAARTSQECFQHGTDLIFVLRLYSTAKTVLRSKVEHIIEKFVNEELGFSPDIPIWGHDGFPNTIWVYLTEQNMGKSHAITSILITEPLHTARRSDTHEEIVDSLEETNILGVNRMWTHRKYRGCGYVRTLLSYARKRFSASSGRILPINRLAFSDPTEAGQRFAAKYCKENVNNTGDGSFYLVYDLKK